MPLNYSIKRKNPLDINNNITIGLAFPLDNINLTQGTLTHKEQVKHNLLNLLLTSPGERYHEPTFGIGLRDLIFESGIELENIKMEIDEKIKFHIPSIKLLGVDVNQEINEHILYVRITYKYNLDNTSDTIQLNFN